MKTIIAILLCTITMAQQIDFDRIPDLDVEEFTPPCQKGGIFSRGERCSADCDCCQPMGNRKGNFFLPDRKVLCPDGRCTHYHKMANGNWRRSDLYDWSNLFDIFGTKEKKPMFPGFPETTPTMDDD